MWSLDRPASEHPYKGLRFGGGETVGPLRQVKVGGLARLNHLRSLIHAT